MSNNDVELAFKIVFILGLVIAVIVVIGFFLLAVRFSLNFIPGGFSILGVHMSVN